MSLRNAPGLMISLCARPRHVDARDLRQHKLVMRVLRSHYLPCGRLPGALLQNGSGRTHGLFPHPKRTYAGSPFHLTLATAVPVEGILHGWLDSLLTDLLLRQRPGHVYNFFPCLND